VGVLVTTGEAEAFLPLGEHVLTSTRTLAGDAAFRRALGASMGGMTITDMTSPDQPLLYANAAFGRLAGFPTTELLHRNCRMLQGPDTDPAAVARIRAAVSAGRECRELLLNYRGPDRTPWWNELHLSPVRDDVGRVVQYIGVQNDVTLRVQAEHGLVLERDRAFAFSSRLQKLAYTDSLTGLMNRRRFEDRFESALLEAQLAEKAVALLFLDLDGFKAVNDSLGHAAGDTLLTAIARRLTESVRSTDLLARFGGDEFLIALSGVDADTANASARQVAAHLAAVVAEPVHLGTERVQVSASIGFSIFPDDADSFGQLLHLADLRMYQHKHPASVTRGD
jgi:diguanylate cyclase (GGDEF)-like protein/PAS domain S-box-containing protein